MIGISKKVVGVSWGLGLGFRVWGLGFGDCVRVVVRHAANPCGIREST